MTHPAGSRLEAAHEATENPLETLSADLDRFLKILDAMEGAVDGERQRLNGGPDRRSRHTI